MKERFANMYIIRGKYTGHEWETIDEVDDKAEAERLLKEYRMAFGPAWVLTIKRERQG